jgi:ribonuclease HII
MSPTAAPTLRFERELLRSGFAALACADEAGRGALCGPVSVGVVVVTEATKPAPKGVRDSKLLAEEERFRLVPHIRQWAAAHAVGMASAAEIDQIGIIAALRLAGHRAIAELPVAPDYVLLDGNHDYLSHSGQPSLFDDQPLGVVPPVMTRVKADLRCAGVAAASILAKTARDALMIDLARDYPEYGWAQNKGYAAPEHLVSLRRLGPSSHHRISWRLPECQSGHGVDDEGLEASGQLASLLEIDELSRFEAAAGQRPAVPKQASGESSADRSRDGGHEPQTMPH